MLAQNAFSRFSPSQQDVGSIWSDRKKALSLNTAFSPQSLELSKLKESISIQNRKQKRIPILNNVLGQLSGSLTIKEFHVGDLSKPTLMLVQDVHGNLEAQKNIAKALVVVSKDRQGANNQAPVVVGVEAASGPFDFDRYLHYPDQTVTKNIADYLLRENKIGAASYFGLTEKKSLSLLGVDSPDLYSKNVQAFKNAALLKGKTQKEIASQLVLLDQSKAKILSPELMHFYDQLKAYHNGELNIADYVLFLSQIVPLKNAPNLDRLISAVDLEKNLNTAQAKYERDRIFHTLSTSNPTASKSLLALGMAYQAGELDAASFYKLIGEQLSKSGINLNTAPHFSSYLTYMHLADAIKHDAVFSEINGLEEDALSKLSNADQQRAFFANARHLHLMEKLVSFELTPAEWADYQKTAKSYEGAMQGLSSFEAFYESAVARNEAMVFNLLKQIPSPKSLASSQIDKTIITGDHGLGTALSVLIAGGFHSTGISEILKRKGISYVIVAPKFSVESNGSGADYLNLFLRERTPLEKLFEGQKLTLANAGQNLGAVPMAGANSPRGVGGTLGLLFAAFTAMKGAATPEKLSAVELALPGAEMVIKDRRAILTLGESVVEVGSSDSSSESIFEHVPELGDVGVKVYNKTPQKWGFGLLAAGGFLNNSNARRIFVGVLSILVLCASALHDPSSFWIAIAYISSIGVMMVVPADFSSDGPDSSYAAPPVTNLVDAILEFQGRIHVDERMDIDFTQDGLQMSAYRMKYGRNGLEKTRPSLVELKTIAPRLLAPYLSIGIVQLTISEYIPPQSYYQVGLNEMPLVVLEQDQMAQFKNELHSTLDRIVADPSNPQTGKLVFESNLGMACGILLKMGDREGIENMARYLSKAEKGIVQSSFLGQKNMADSFYSALSLKTFLELGANVIPGDEEASTVQSLAALSTYWAQILKRLSGIKKNDLSFNHLAEINLKLIFSMAQSLNNSVSTDNNHMGGKIINSLLTGFEQWESLGQKYDPVIFGASDNPVWKQFRGSVKTYINSGSFNENYLTAFSGSISFIDLLGLDLFNSLVETYFTSGLHNLGVTKNVWAQEIDSAKPLIKIWKAVDSSQNPVLQRRFYKVAWSHSRDIKAMAAFLELATADALLYSRVMSFLTLTYEIMKWPFVDQKMPWTFLILALHGGGQPSIVKFKQLFASVLLRKAPLEIGLPGDGKIKDMSQAYRINKETSWDSFSVIDAPESVNPQNLTSDIHTLDSAIERQVFYFGLDSKAVELVEARIEFWLTGSPDVAISKLNKYADEPTRTWRNSAMNKKLTPLPEMVALFEQLMGRESLTFPPVNHLLELSNEDLMRAKSSLTEIDGLNSEVIQRLFDVEIPLYRELHKRFGLTNGAVDVNLLRGWSHSGLPISSNNIDLDIFDLPWLIHRTVHHETGQNAYELVLAQFHEWRTGDIGPAVRWAEQNAPLVTKTWRRTNPVGKKRPLVVELYKKIAQIRHISPSDLPDDIVATLPQDELETAHRGLLENSSVLINQQEINLFFERDVQLIRGLKKRYDPMEFESAVSRLSHLADVFEPSDPVISQYLRKIVPLLKSVDENPFDLLQQLIELRKLMARHSLGIPNPDKFGAAKEGEKPGYAQQHGIYNMYGYKVSDPVYLIFLLDTCLKPIDEKVLLDARLAIEALQNDGAAYVQAATNLLSLSLNFLSVSGWGNQGIIDLAEILESGPISPKRLELVAHRVTQHFEDLEHWRNLQWGEMIDALASSVTFDELNPNLAQSLNIRSPADLWARSNILMPKMMEELLRRNAPLFFLKDLAIAVESTLSRLTGEVGVRPQSAESRALFFPQKFFPKESGTSRLADQSQKATNLILLGRIEDQVAQGNKMAESNYLVPPGMVYPVGMPSNQIISRASTDLSAVATAIQTQKISALLGSEIGDQANNPILFSIRSGGIFDAPGQQHTVTNWGISEKNIGALAERIGAWGAWDSLRRYYQEYAMAVLHMDRDEFRKIMDDYKDAVGVLTKKEFSDEQMRDLALLYKERINRDHFPGALPDSLEDQLEQIVHAIQTSWDNHGMTDFRKQGKMEHESGSAVIIQVMMHGNSTVGNISGAGAVYSPDWAWEDANGSFAPGMTGADIVDGVITPLNFNVLKSMNQRLFDEINHVVRSLQEYFGLKIQLEYTIQNDVFSILQIRSVPYENMDPGFVEKQLAAAPLLADGYRLSGSSGKGPILSVTRLNEGIEVIREKLTSAELKKLSECKLISEVESILLNIYSSSAPQEKRQLNLLLKAVQLVKKLRIQEPLFVDQIGIVVAAKEALPEDFEYMRFFPLKIVTGLVSNKGGPGAHEQELSIQTRLKSVAGISTGKYSDQMKPNGSNGIEFLRDGKPLAVLKESKDVITLNGRGAVMNVYKGNVPFETNEGLVGSQKRWPVVFFNPGWEELLRTLVLGVAGHYLYSISFSALVVGGGLVSLLIITLMVFAHRLFGADNKTQFGQRFKGRLNRQIFYTALFWLMWGGLILSFGESFDHHYLAVLAVSWLISYMAHMHWNYHAFDNGKPTDSITRDSSDTLPLLGLSDWKQTRHLFKVQTWRGRQNIRAKISTPFIDSGKTVAHYSLADLIYAQEQSANSSSRDFKDNFHNQLTFLLGLINSREGSFKKLVLTIPEEYNDDQAISAINDLLTGQVVLRDRFLQNVILDRSSVADPLAVKAKYANQIGGRKLHSTPLPLGEKINWALAAMGNADLFGRNAIIIEIVDLLNGDSLFVQNGIESAFRALQKSLIHA